MATLRHLGHLALVAIVVVFAALHSNDANAAAYATGGSSIYRDQVLWLTWGGGVNGTPNVRLDDGASTSASLTVAAGVNLDVSCSLSNISAANTLRSYRPGTFRGDSLDDLYNIGGTGTSNRLIAGISRTNGRTSFRVTCSSTLGGAPYNLRGLVVADAESTNGGNEYVQGTAAGTWNVVEVRKNLSAGRYIADKTGPGVIRLGPGNDNNTAAVSFLSFDNPSSTVGMDFELRGGGTQAIAIGLLVPFADFGDAPTSYGEVIHLVNDLRFDSDGIAVGSAVNINTAAYRPGQIISPRTDFLGAVGAGTEQRPRGSGDGRGDDVNPITGRQEEDALPIDFIVHAPRAGEIITQTVQCNGAGTVAGWIDFDQNGAFNPLERAEAACSGGTASLSWTSPVNVAVGTSFARLRYSTVAAQLQSPTGIADDGEVEDHPVTFARPELTIAKTSNAVNGEWAIGQTDAQYSLTVTNGSTVSTLYPGDTDAAPITVLDLLPNGITPRWTGTLTTNGWNCTFLNQLVTCTTNQELGAGAQSTLNLPVNVTEDVASQSINYASVGGGRDPFNNEGPPQPGPTCQDAAHCAQHLVTIDTDPALTIVKTGTLNDLNGNNLINLGETIRYAFRVTNTGAVTLTGVTVDDPLLSNAGIALDQGPQTLAPGGSFTFTATYTPNQTDIDAGSVTNTATATGTTPGGAPAVSPPDSETVPPAQTAALTIVKTGTLNDPNSNNLIDLGETITYAFHVTNTGAVTLTGVTVDDPLLSNAGIALDQGPQTLAPGGSFTFTATYTPNQTDIDAGSVTNTATATGTTPGGAPAVSPPDSETVPPAQSAALTIVKTGTLNDLNGNNLIDLGETITYAFLVTNTGALTLTRVTVDDPLLSNAGIALDQGRQTLAPGSSFTFTATYTPNQANIDAGSVTNTATATGATRGGTPAVSPPDTVTILPAQTAALTIVKTGTFNDVDGDGLASLGDTISYSFLITNTGSVTVESVTPDDRGPRFSGQPGTGSLSPFVPGPVSLAPGVSQDFVATYGLTQADINLAAGSPNGVENTAVALGQRNGNPVSSNTTTSNVTLPGAVPANLHIVKQAQVRHIRTGERAPYIIRVTNASNVLFENVAITDTLPSGFRFVEGSASVDGTAVTPVVAGLNVRFEGLTIAPNSEVVVRLQTLALSSAGPGQHVNRATLTDASGNPLTPQAQAVVEILVDPVFDCGEIIGTVFDDLNRNGYQDDGEPGLPGVRVATARGWLITTDRYGRFHVPCAAVPDQRIGSNFIMKLDPRTLPSGYRITTENPRVVRLTPGKTTKLNFGASIGRVVRLDLQDAAFVTGQTQLRDEWEAGIDRLIKVLSGEPQVLRLTYFAASPDPLIHKRLDGIKSLIAERWKRRGGSYPLEIETRLEVGQ